MKVKEVERCGHVAWSPPGASSIRLACATAAQQLDASFSSTARLDVFSLAIEDASMTMPLAASISTADRFHCVEWGGVSGGDMIVCGCDSGHINMYSAHRLLSSLSHTDAGQLTEADVLLHRATRHKGAVHSLDFNPFQPGLLVSGGEQSEVFIWDVQKPAIPMTPGTQSVSSATAGSLMTATDHVASVAWNRQVKHILASTSATVAAHRCCVVWDLRKNEPIIKVSEAQAGMRCKVLAWHPDVSTQLVLASDEQLSAGVQLWDLRFATSPLHSLQRHSKGVLSLAWNNHDSHLLLSAGKDDTIVCWDVHADSSQQQVVAELCASSQWNFSVRWCAGSASLVSASSFDGRVAVYNITGAVQEPPTLPSAELADSFPNLGGVAAALPSIRQRVSTPLSRPPDWMKRPCGATFGFGGRLVLFDNVTSCTVGGASAAEVANKTDTTSGGVSGRCVEIHQVVTEHQLVQRCHQFQQALQSGQLLDYCTSRAYATTYTTSSSNNTTTPSPPVSSSSQQTDNSDTKIWRFLSALCDQQQQQQQQQQNQQPHRVKLLQLLGYWSQQQSTDSSTDYVAQNGGLRDIDGDMDEMRVSPDASSSLHPPPQCSANNNNNNNNNNNVAQDSVLAEPEELFDIPSGDDTDGQVCVAMLRGDISAAVNACISAGRTADALIMALSHSQQLYVETRDKYLDSMKTDMCRLIRALVTRDWLPVVQCCDPGSWREALAAVLTHAPSHQQNTLCTELGSRLEAQHTQDMWDAAMLCYVCATNVDKLIHCWQHTRSDTLSPCALQNLVEQALVLDSVRSRMNTATTDNTTLAPSSGIASKLVQYAHLLTSQGCLQPVLFYLSAAPGTNNHPEVVELYERVRISLQLTASPPDGSTNAAVSGVGSSARISRVSGGHKDASVFASADQLAPAAKYQKAGYMTPSFQPASVAPSVFTPNFSSCTSSGAMVGSVPASSTSLLSPATAIIPPSLPPPSSAATAAPFSQFCSRVGDMSGAGVTPSSTAALSTAAAGYRLSSRRQHVLDPSTSSSFPAASPCAPLHDANVPQMSYSYGCVSGGVTSSSSLSAVPLIPQPASLLTPQLPPTPLMDVAPGQGVSMTSTVPGVTSYAAVPSTSSGPGWNDPPPLRNSAKKCVGSSTLLHTVTQPIYNPAEMIPPNNNNNMYTMSNASVPPPPSMGQMSPYNSQHMSSASSGLMSPASISAGAMNVQTVSDNQQQQQQQQDELLDKAAIPEQHVVIHETFERLLTRCDESVSSLNSSCAGATGSSSAAVTGSTMLVSSLPMLTRRLQDARRKITVLYDLMRQQRISDNTLAGIHQIVPYVAQSDFNSALQMLQHVMSVSNFAEVSRYMPAMKSLLQIAAQLQVRM